MALRFFNTLSRSKEDFSPIKAGEVKMYSCGPTVYNFAHIGNFRSYVFSDILRRYLKYKGYEVFHVMNLTDVDDKTIRDSQKEGLSLKEFTEKYTDFFYKDRDTLNIEKVEVYPKATDHIKEMIDITNKLDGKGFAYKSEDGSTYYDVSEFDGYGKLSKIQFTGLKAGARVKQDEYEKDSASDFALWKGYDSKDGDVAWETSYGKGRPGWHIECSAMSMKYLGETFDIHTGGIDLIFPHHENEIAQSEAATGKKFVNYWMHCEHLLVNDEKMSKSKGNFFTLKDVLAKGYSPKAVRYLLLSTHYRQKLNFTFEGLSASENTIEKIREFLGKLRLVQEKKDNPDVKKAVMKAKAGFDGAMDDDLNISEALSHIFDFIKDINRLMGENAISRHNSLECYNLMMEFDRVLGIMEFTEEAIPPEISGLADRREKARKDKDWKLADMLRLQIDEKGYTVSDTGKGYILKRRA
jgi:cysteinyl-tRNA synthetase